VIMDGEVVNESATSTIRVSGGLDDPVALLGMAHVGLLAKPERLVIDLGNCTAIDARGISALFAVERLCGQPDVLFNITPSDVVRRRLATSRSRSGSGPPSRCTGVAPGPASAPQRGAIPAGSGFDGRDKSRADRAPDL
jgi:hypothetical protein